MHSLEKLILAVLIGAISVSGCFLNDLTGSEDRYVLEEGGTLAEWKDKVITSEGSDSQVSITLLECK
ncbi:hypothetical protein EXS74_01040 [Candidatus Woesearchaeota archaeon]|nr:hypothetical protein [Candidatus Woesearchaeota archaeon]